MKAYIKHNRRSDTYSVYATVLSKRKVIARVKAHHEAVRIRNEANRASMSTILLPRKMDKE